MEYEIILPNEQTIVVRLSQQPRHSCKGADLFKELFEKLELAKEEQKYFGLMYCDKEDGQMDWLEKDDVLKNIRMSKSSRFHFSVRYYPQHPELVLHDEKTRKLFRVQIKEKLLKGQWGCDTETHAYLDSLIVQAELGDYNPKYHKAGYLESIKGVDISAPSRLNSEKDETEAHYLQQVHYYHKRNMGIVEKDAHTLYLTKAREIPHYGFIIHEAVDKNGNILCIGLREQSIAILDQQFNSICSPFMIKSEFFWNSLKFCTSVKCKVKVGVTIQKENITELTWKVKSKNCFRGAQRLCNDIKAFREMYSSRDESDFCKTRKEIKRARSFAKQSSRERPKLQRLNTFTTVLRNSLRRKKKSVPREPDMHSPVKETSFCQGSANDNSTIGLVPPDIQ